MKTRITDLKESKEFLNLLLDNIDSAILILDENLQIHEFNKSFLSLFDRPTDRVFGTSFGTASGCINAFREGKSCGETTQCKFCVLKNTLRQTIVDSMPVHRKRIDRVFFIDGHPISKHLEFSSRPITFKKRHMVLIIIHDITEIEKQKQELEEQQRKIDQDLQTASDLQKSLLPDLNLELSNIKTAWRFEPCLHLGGDLFQIHEVTKNHISIYALDVCGHGISSALVSVAISQFLSSLHNRMRLTGKLFSPDAVMHRLDRVFPIDRFDCFFTIAYATLNVTSGKVVYSNAGHMPPLILRTNGKLDVLTHHNPAIGTGFNTSFSQKEELLYPGDRLFLYSDGLVENFGKNGEREGKERLYASLKASRDLKTAEIVNQVFDQADLLRGNILPTDDMSLVGVEYIPNK